MKLTYFLILNLNKECDVTLYMTPITLWLHMSQSQVTQSYGI